MILGFYDVWWKILILVVCSYAFGNINFAMMISGRHKKDITESGSGNPGTMNMLRTFGIRLGALTLVLDILKGFLPAMAGYLLFRGQLNVNGFEWSIQTQYWAGLAAVIGHICPLFLKRGGKGIATTMGVFLWCIWWLAAICFVLGVLYIYFFEYGGVGSLIMVTGYTVGAITMYFLQFVVAIELFVLAGVILVFPLISFIKHAPNIRRMIAGTENRTKLREMLRRKKKPVPAEPAPDEPSEADKSSDKRD